MNVNMDVNNLPLTSNQATVMPPKPAKSASPVVLSIPASFGETKSQNVDIAKGVDPIDIDNQIKASQEQIDKAMQQIKEKTKDMSFSVNMRYDERINRTIAKIVDKITGNVIKEIPPEDLVKVAVMIKDMAEGIIIDNQA
ncbi:MAG: flagellar protein FlaG [Candidatus Margulisbacteria bacterium]|nr:flagellar protein FlaG [Candidatus Margulisiibacteriota bacterium]